MDLRMALAVLDAVDKSALDGEFAHFLERRSYVKALAWLARNPESIHGS